MELSGCSDSNLGPEFCAFLDGITSNYGCTIMGGNTACASTCASCNSTATLVITHRADEVNSFDRDAKFNQFDVLKNLEELFDDKDRFALYVDMLDRQKVN